MTVKPRYKFLRTSYAGCNLYHAGTELDFTGWPNLVDMEPLNDAAREVCAWLVKWGHDREIRPAKPWNDEAGELYLPVRFSSPKWRATRPVLFDGQVMTPGFLAWSNRWPVDGVVSANEPAAQVQAFFDAHNGERLARIAWDVKEGRVRTAADDDLDDSLTPVERARQQYHATIASNLRANIPGQPPRSWNDIRDNA